MNYPCKMHSKKYMFLKKFGFWITDSLVIRVILNVIINSAHEAVVSGCLRLLLPVDESWLLFLPMIPWPASYASCLPFRSYLSHSFSPNIVSACPDHRSRSGFSVVKEARPLFTSTWSQSKHSAINWKRVHHCVEKSRYVSVYLWYRTPPKIIMLLDNSGFLRNLTKSLTLIVDEYATALFINGEIMLLRTSGILWPNGTQRTIVSLLLRLVNRAHKCPTLSFSPSTTAIQWTVFIKWLLSIFTIIFLYKMLEDDYVYVMIFLNNVELQL